MWTSCLRWVPARYVGTIDAIDADDSELSVLFPSSEAGGNAAAVGSRAVVYACTIHKSKGSATPRW